MTRTLLATVVAAFAMLAAASAAPPAKIYVLLWFDTEDYILPASDDAALKLADWLHREGIRATFKVVGEKARTLEKRHRTDVIASLRKHEIGYHSNWHSVQPTPALYLSNLGWDEGVSEFDRREKPGFNDVQRIFGVTPTCYGQPGSSWGPQSFGAMDRWGMKVYLDAGKHVGLDGRPHYYCGLLTLYQLTHTIRTNLGGPTDLKPAEDRFIQARNDLLKEGGGVVSIVYHPCEFVHRKFWDGVNFLKGANPPRELWQLPPVKTEVESKTAYETFEAYIRFIKRFPEVQFITASEAGGIYRDLARGRALKPQEVRVVARAVGHEPDFQRHGDWTLSPVEVLSVLVRYVPTRWGGKNGDTVSVNHCLGPTGAGPAMPNPVTTDLSQFQRTTADVAEYLARHGRVPSAVWLGSQPVTPESYLVALARILDMPDPLPKEIVLKPARLGTAKWVADDDPKLWPWVIFPPGFRAPAMMDLARKQAWTVKPAVLHAPAKP